MAAGIRRSATRRKLTPDNRENVDQCADYLLNHASYLHYDECLAAGFPIATGVIEGACRHLVAESPGAVRIGHPGTLSIGLRI